MKRRVLFNNNQGLSLLYDTVLFIVMVSLAGITLLPALQSTLEQKTTLDTHREQVVDDALHTFLVSKADYFEYRFGGTLLDDLAKKIGIDTTSHGLYSKISQWFLGHEQYHKTYAALLSENLGSQLCIPVSNLHRLNLFTNEYYDYLSNEIQKFFYLKLGDKYHFNFNAWWYPIKEISFGGEISVGDPPPNQDCYVAHTTIIMPYTPKITIHNHTILFTKQWLKNILFGSAENRTNYSSIPPINNITIILQEYVHKIPPFDAQQNATTAMEENVSTLVYGFLVDGITNESSVIIFPGIVNITLTTGFETIKTIVKDFTNDTIDKVFGGVIHQVDQIFSNLNQTMENPVVHLLTDSLNQSLQTFLNISWGTLDETLETFKRIIQENITRTLKTFFTPLIDQFIKSLFHVLEILQKFVDIIIDWLFDMISFNTADVTLTIWEIHR